MHHRPPALRKISAILRHRLRFPFQPTDFTAKNVDGRILFCPFPIDTPPPINSERLATKTVGWVGTGFNRYMLKLGGTEDGRHQGGPLIDPETQETYRRAVPREEVATVTDALLEFYVSERQQEEARLGGMGYFFRKIPTESIIVWLKSHPNTAHLMTKTSKSIAAKSISSSGQAPSVAQENL